MRWVLGAAAVVALVASGCAGRGTVRRVEADVERLRAELADARAARESSDGELARARGEIAALDARTREQDGSARALAAEVSRLTERLGAAEEAIRRLRSSTEAPAPPASASPAAAEASDRSARTPRAATPERAYAAALATLRAREHGQAVLDFLEFIANHPGHPLVANAQYWIGEAYYVQRDFRQAILEFRKARELGPGKAADALLKIGLCYWSLRDHARARQTWREVVRDYPGSAAAETARAQLGVRTIAR